MKKIKPALLKPGDKIGIVSPARFVVPSEIAGAKEWIKRQGYIPILGKHVFDQQNQFAGSDIDRASDIKNFLEDPEISCIWSTRGGYGSARLIPYLADISLSVRPKWFVGYSDVTVFHSWLHTRFNLQSIHGPMLFSWGESPETQESFKALAGLLATGNIDYEFSSNTLNRGEDLRGVLIGGNLSMLISLRGTPLDLDVKNKILFLEDVDEYLYNIDRMMQNLKLGGWLDKISGLLVGGMTDMNDNSIPFGQSPEEIITSLSVAAKVPVFFAYPSGHQERNMPLIFGEEIQIKKQGSKIYCHQ